MIVDLHGLVINSIDTINLTNKHVVTIKVDTGAMPMANAKEYMESIRDVFQTPLAPAQVIVIPHTTEITILKPEE